MVRFELYSLAERLAGAFAPALGVSGGFNVEFLGDFFQFGLSTEDQHEPEVSSYFEAIGFHYVDDVVTEGLLALVGVGHVRNVAALPTNDKGYSLACDPWI